MEQSDRELQNPEFIFSDAINFLNRAGHYSNSIEESRGVYYVDINQIFGFFGDSINIDDADVAQYLSNIERQAVLLKSCVSEISDEDVQDTFRYERIRSKAHFIARFGNFGIKQL